MLTKTATFEIAVSVSDSARSALLTWTIRFDVDPPGLATSSTIPSAKTGASPKTQATRKPSAGNMSSWLNNPTPTAFF